MSLLLILASPPVVLPPKAGSATVLDHPTICHQYAFLGLELGSWGMEVKGKRMVVVRTAGEKSIFGEDCYRVDEEDRDCKTT
jgi:hypothetical protein